MLTMLSPWRSPRSVPSPDSSSSVGRAVPVLARPFPVHSEGILQTAALPKDPRTGRLGVHFRWNGVGGAVTIKELSNSSSSSSHLKVGQAVLAVDGQPVSSSKHAARLVRESPHAAVRVTTCEAPHRQAAKLPPFCKIVAAPRVPHQHPGIVLDGTRNRCLVQIARVFSQGPFGNNSSSSSSSNNSTNSEDASSSNSCFALNQGDIVLAVNGVPVSTVAAADAALQQETPTPYTVLYVVDMTAYRRSIGDEMAGSPSFGEQRVRWVNPDDEDDNDSSYSRHRHRRRHRNRNTNNPHNSPSSTVQLVKRSRNNMKERYFELHVDFATQRFLVDETNKNSATITAFANAFNERLEKRMRVLEEAVNVEAWKHTATTTSATSTTRTTAATTAVSRTASLERSNSTTSTEEEVEESSSSDEEDNSEETPSDMSSNSSSSSSSSSNLSPPRSSSSNGNNIKKARSNSQDDIVDADRDDDDISYCTIPLATATLEVLPVSALQTLAERNSCSSVSAA